MVSSTMMLKLYTLVFAEKVAFVIYSEAIYPLEDDKMLSILIKLDYLTRQKKIIMLCCRNRQSLVSIIYAHSYMTYASLLTLGARNLRPGCFSAFDDTYFLLINIYGT